MDPFVRNLLSIRLNSSRSLVSLGRKAKAPQPSWPRYAKGSVTSNPLSALACGRLARETVLRAPASTRSILKLAEEIVWAVDSHDLWLAYSGVDRLVRTRQGQGSSKGASTTASP